MARTVTFNFDKAVAELLRKGREEAGLGVRELARMAGVDPAYISRIESGKTVPRDWIKVANMVKHMPSSELAQRVAERGVLKSAVLEGQREVLMMTLYLPPSVYEDEPWLKMMVHLTQQTLAILELKARPSRKLETSKPRKSGSKNR